MTRKNGVQFQVAEEEAEGEDEVEDVDEVGGEGKAEVEGGVVGDHL